MNLIILASVLIASLLIAIGVKKSNKEVEKAKAEFWDKEYRSNFVRKKPLDNLNYISIPEILYNLKYDLSDSKVKDAYDCLIHLKECKIVNFSGISNTDLKLEYGTANITVLSEYDYNYTILVRSLQTLAESLYAANDTESATTILEFSIETGTDISSTYKLLGDIYNCNGSHDKLSALIEKANGLSGLMKTSIVEYLTTLNDNPA